MPVTVEGFLVFLLLTVTGTEPGKGVFLFFLLILSPAVYQEPIMSLSSCLSFLLINA